MTILISVFVIAAIFASIYFITQPKCPHCGSKNLTEKVKELYRCNDCHKSSHIPD